MPNFILKYKCPNCGTEWEDVWSSIVEDECPNCGLRHITPVEALEDK